MGRGRAVDLTARSWPTGIRRLPAVPAAAAVLIRSDSITRHGSLQRMNCSGKTDADRLTLSICLEKEVQVPDSNSLIKEKNNIMELQLTFSHCPRRLW